MAFRYMLEIHKQNGKGLQLDRALLVPPTATLRMPHEHATDLRYTLGSLPIREHTPNRRIMVELSGDSGLQPRAGQGRDGKTLTADGPTLAREFRAFLADYQDIAAQQGARYLLDAGRGVRTLRQGAAMVLRAFDDDLHVYVEPRSFELARDVRGSRLTYRWTLQLEAYALAEPTPTPSPLSSANPAALARKSSASTSAAISKIEAWMQRGRDRLGVANDLILGVRRPLLRLKRAGATLQGLTADARRLVLAPAAALADVYQSARSVRVALANLLSASATAEYASANELRRLRRLLGLAETAQRDALTALGASGGKPGDLLSADNAESQFPSSNPKSIADATAAPPTSTYTLQVGETLISLAARLLGDPALWSIIAKLNGMQDANTKGSGLPLLPGDKLKIPAAAAGLPAQDSDPFGTDFYVDPTTGDLAGLQQDVVYNEAATGALTVTVSEVTDLQTVTGPDNALQALRLRLLTEQGSWRLRPFFGVAPAVGGKVLATAQAELAARASEQLRADARVAAIRALDVRDDGDGLTLLVDVDLVDGSPAQVLVPAA